MEAVLPLLLIIAAVICIIAFRLIAGSFDHSRISKYVSSRGGQVFAIEWSPFGRGWLGSQNERIYEVWYFDANGQRHQATCKTSMLSGVYFTEDKIVTGHEATNVPDTPEDARMKYERWRRLEDENRRLQAEVERLRHEHQD